MKEIQCDLLSLYIASMMIVYAIYEAYTIAQTQYNSLELNA